MSEPVARQIGEQPTLEDILADFMCRCDAGEHVSPDALIHQFPHMEVELRDYFDDLHTFEDIAQDGTTPIAENVASTIGDFEDYEILGEIARGGMGVVLRARQKSLGRIVALKMIRSGSLASPAELARFRLEIETNARLRHPNIVRVYDTGQHQGQPYYTMEFIDGQDLQQMTREYPLPAEQAALYIAKAADAVHYAHTWTLHRDLKPSNILVDEWGEVHVTDFGLAKRLDVDSSLTGGEDIVGTANYMPPEQAKPQARRLDCRSDVYALGAVLYELLTGRPPFAGASVLDTIDQVLTGDPLPPRILNAKIPNDIQTICLKCLEKEPERRYASACELRDDLRRFLDGQPIIARPASAIYRFVKFAKRNKALVAGTASTAGAILVGCAVATWMLKWARNEQRHAVQLQQSAQAAALESYVARSNYLLQTGKWPEAESYLRRAIDAGYGDPRELKMKLAEVLHAKNETQKARNVLESLGTEDKDAALLLVEGDLLLSGDHDKAVELIKRAQEIGLPNQADSAYAEALLTSDWEEMLSELQLVLESDPGPNRRLRACHMKGIALFFLGRLDELRSHCSAAQMMYSGDANFVFLKAMAIACQGDLPEAQKLVGDSRHIASDREIKAMHAILALLYQGTRPENHWDANDVFSSYMARIKFLAAIKELAVAGGLVLNERANSSQFAMPPQLYGVNVRSLMMDLFTRSFFSAKRSARFNAIVDALPEPPFYNVYGRLLLREGDFRGAEQAFTKALSRTSVFPVRLPALYGLVKSQLEIATDLSGGERTGKLKEASRHLAQFIEEGGLDYIHLADPEDLVLRASDLIDRAKKLNDEQFVQTAIRVAYDVARAWETSSAENPRTTALHGLVDMKAGAYMAALERFDSALISLPDWQELRNWRAEAVTQIIAKAEELSRADVATTPKD